jgi:glycosyltransferase involved in cell wall biosynthesis
MRILVFFPGIVRGGCEEHALILALAGARAGHDVVTCFPRTPGTASILADVHANGLAVAEWPLGHLAGVCVQWGTPDIQAVETMRVLDATKPDALLLLLPTPEASLGVITACAALSVPAVPIFCLVPGPMEIPHRLRAVCAAVRRRHQRWVAVSDDNRRHLCASFAIDTEEDVTVVRNGVDLPEPWRDPTAHDVERARLALRRELDLPDQTRIVLTVGRLASQKGHPDLLDAIGRLPADCADAHFVWVGEGEKEAALRAAIEAADLDGRVHLLGYRRDVAALLHAADLFVLPTRWEGCSRALLEAMSAGLPTVVSDASSNPELVETGHHGLLFPVGDRVRLAEAVAYALTHPGDMRRMGDTARERARRELTAAAMCDGTYRVIDEVMEGPRLPADPRLVNALGGAGPSVGCAGA